jgi:hypothetical protein
MTFTSQIQDFAKKVDTLTTKAYQGSCYQVSYDIAEGSPVSTGRLLGSWSPAKGNMSPYHFKGGESAWVKSGRGWVKDSSIADQNRASAMSDLNGRISGTVSDLSKKEAYYFTNDTPYIKNAEHEGWQNTGAYHMRENALLNWQNIVDSVVKGLNK